MKNHTTLTAAVAALALAATGCGAEAGTTEPLDTSQEAFTAYVCGTAGADAEYEGSLDPPVIGSNPDSSCGYVVDLEDLSAVYTGGGDVSDARIAVQWGGAPLTTEQTCRWSHVTAIFYVWDVIGSSNASVGGTTSTGPVYGWSPLADRQASVGTWNGTSCAMEVNVTGLVAGEDYRVAAIARTRNSRRNASIGTYKPANSL